METQRVKKRLVDQLSSELRESVRHFRRAMQQIDLDPEEDLTAILKSIKSDLDLDHDQDLDHPHQSINPIQGDLFEQFTNECQSVGLSVDNLDIRGIDRNITWYFGHISDIKSKRSYISKMIANCPEKKPKVLGFVPGGKEENNGLIMGYESAEVDRMVPYLDEHIFRQIQPKIPGFKTLFQNYSDVINSEMKRRVVTAYAMEAGLL